jgi:hypothetical protein
MRDVAFLAIQLAKVAALLFASYAFVFVFFIITP